MNFFSVKHSYNKKLTRPPAIGNRLVQRVMVEEPTRCKGVSKSSKVGGGGWTVGGGGGHHF